MKKIVILGSTGSIGLSTLSVVEALPEKLSIVGVAVNSDYETALKQAEKFGFTHIAVSDKDAAARCSKAAPAGITVYGGSEGVEEVAALDEADIVLCSVVGTAGLKPVLAAVAKGKDIALATKEVLVAGGNVVSEACRKSGSKLLPVDSEHGAILQCLSGIGEPCVSGLDDMGGIGGKVRRLLLTASGGPFYFKKDLDLATVTVEQALNHPNWDMGSKVTIDSATLMNKGLEVIEARWLFDMPVEKIDVLVHPQSIIHSMVEFADGSTLAQLSDPDMKHAIQYALTYPERYDGALPGLGIDSLREMTFLEPDMDRFPCLRLAREAAAAGGTMAVVMNGANEAAVEMFLDGRISFPDIWGIVEGVMNKHENKADPALEDILAADSMARELAVVQGGF